MTQKSDTDLRDLKLDLAIVDNTFDKRFKEEESLNGVMNMKLIKIKNIDFRLKLEAWKRRLDERSRQLRRAFEHGKKLRTVFDKYQDDFNREKERVISCVLDYNTFTEVKDKTQKDQKVIV